MTKLWQQPRTLTPVGLAGYTVMKILWQIVKSITCAVREWTGAGFLRKNERERARQRAIERGERECGRAGR